MDRVLIVDDDVQLCRLLAERLGSESFTIEAVNDGIHGLERALSMEHALVVLDLMLPGMGGLEVLRRLRAKSPVPVLILTARGEDIDRILGLEIGADQYNTSFSKISLHSPMVDERPSHRLPLGIAPEYRRRRDIFTRWL